MNQKIKSVLLGLIDGILPGVRSSIQKTNEGQMEINYARLFASVLGYGCFVALLKGWITLDTAISVLKILFNVE